MSSRKDPIRPIWAVLHRRPRWVKPSQPRSRAVSEVGPAMMTSTLDHTLTPPPTLTPARADLLRDRNFIAGEWRAAHTGRKYDVSDPASGTVFAHVPDSDPEDARRASDAAYAAFEEWRALSARDRAQLL